MPNRICERLAVKCEKKKKVKDEIGHEKCWVNWRTSYKYKIIHFIKKRELLHYGLSPPWCTETLFGWRKFSPLSQAPSLQFLLIISVRRLRGSKWISRRMLPK